MGYNLNELSANTVEQYYNEGRLSKEELKEWVLLSNSGEFPRYYLIRPYTKPISYMANKEIFCIECMNLIRKEDLDGKDYTFPKNFFQKQA